MSVVRSSWGIVDEEPTNHDLQPQTIRDAGAEWRAAQIYCAGPFEMIFHSEWISLNGG